MTFRTSAGEAAPFFRHPHACRVGAERLHLQPSSVLRDPETLRLESPADARVGLLAERTLALLPYVLDGTTTQRLPHALQSHRYFRPAHRPHCRFLHQKRSPEYYLWLPQQNSARQSILHPNRATLCLLTRPAIRRDFIQKTTLTSKLTDTSTMGYEDSVYLAKLAEQAERYEGKCRSPSRGKFCSRR